MEKGSLYLFPTTLGDGPSEDVLPKGTLALLNRIDIFIAEEIRTARRFLKKAGITRNLDEITFFLLNEHTKQQELDSYLEPAEKGKSIGLLSEAGTPCVADPGSVIVSMAHNRGIRVIPLTGPSSILLALMASGFNGQDFSFAGYLPIEREKRKRKLKELEKAIYEKNQTQLFIETPYRNNQMVRSVLEVCKGETMLCLAVDLTMGSEMIVVKSVYYWRKKIPDINKRPCVFLLYK